jgi:hypothetical protein
LLILSSPSTWHHFNIRHQQLPLALQFSSSLITKGGTPQPKRFYILGGGGYFLKKGILRLRKKDQIPEAAEHPAFENEERLRAEIPSRPLGLYYAVSGSIDQKRIKILINPFHNTKTVRKVQPSRKCL